MTAHLFRLIGAIAVSVVIWGVVVALVATLIALRNDAAWRFVTWAVYAAGAAMVVFVVCLIGEYLSDPEARR